MTAEDFVNAKVITVDSVPFWEYKDGVNEFVVENSLGLFRLSFEYKYRHIANLIDLYDIELIYLDNDEEPEIEITHKQVEQWIDKQRNF